MQIGFPIACTKLCVKGHGAATKTLIALAQHFAPLDDMLLLRARKDGRDIAAVLIFIHGKAATYQIGWTSPDLGRKCNAHHFLLWQAMDMLINAEAVSEGQLASRDLLLTSDDGHGKKHVEGTADARAVSNGC